jgi:hypothetical protein
MAKKPTIPKLKKRLDSYFSKYIRHNYSPDGIHCTCFTCGKEGLISEMDNGHHISRAISPTRYSESNCRPQCRYCNRFREGMQHDFARNLQLEIGIDAYDQMVEESRQPWKWDRIWLEEKIKYYQDELKAMGV